MSKLALSALVIVAGVVAVQGSLFGPFGPFGQPAAPPAFGPPGFGQPGAFFPGFGYQPAAPVYQPAFGPPGFPVGFAPVPYAPLASRTVVPVPGGVPASPGRPATLNFRPKPSPVMQRLENRRNELPEDLLEQYDQLVVARDEGYATCDANYPTFGFLAGLHRRCVVLAKVAAEQAATALEKEADDRAAAEQAAADQAAAEQAAAEQAVAEQAAAEQAAAEQAAAEQAAAEQAVAEQAAAEQAAAEQDAAEQAAAEQAAAEQAAAEQAAAEQATAEEAVADEAEVDVVEVADDVEEPTAEDGVDADSENTAVDESSTVA